MDYLVEVFNRDGVRVGAFTEVPLLEVVLDGPDEDDRVEGLLPISLAHFGVGYGVRVSLAGAVIVNADVVESRPAWGDVQRLIVDRYVNFQELIAFAAVGDRGPVNGRVTTRFQNDRIDTMIRTLINSASGPAHYTVTHEAYPDGAVREFEKFEARRVLSAPLPTGAIDSGQWVDSSRLELSGAYAKDGDTIAGLVVDGEAWPDLRLLMIDCEESSLNSHAVSRHPELADWDEAQYDRSVYKYRADKATARLQAYIDEKGIDYIELNPHQDGSGLYDDRVDIYGRYLGMVYGGGECFNAGLVEEGLADVYLYAEGRYHVPDMALKDFYSYRGVHADSIAPCDTIVRSFEARGGVLEVVAALAAMADGFVFHVDREGAIHFRAGDVVDDVVEVNPVEVGVELGQTTTGLVNLLRIQGNPQDGIVDGYHDDDESIDALGTAFRFLPYYGIRRADDAALLAQGLLRDLAWPTRVGRALFYRGVAHLGVGSLLEFRGAMLSDRDAPLSAPWREALGNRHVGRVSRVVHELAGTAIETRLDLSSPFRSVASPLTFIIRSQDSLAAFFQFRLDDGGIGLDIGYHLD